MSTARPDDEGPDSTDEGPDSTEERVSQATREAETAEEMARHEADRQPTSEEAEAAAEAARHIDPDVAEHEREMMEIGAEVEGEGEIS